MATGPDAAGSCGSTFSIRPNLRLGILSPTKESVDGVPESVARRALFKTPFPRGFVDGFGTGDRGKR